ncbi:MAG: TetR/AcrR family transcriptional regulator [Aeromicrobium sp.]
MTEAVSPLRPRTNRLPRKARREQLLRVALEVFVEQGFHSASMDEISERAGVSKPVLYQHFPGKLDLYLALLETSADTVVDSVREALASTSDNKRRVQATIAHWYDYVSEETAAFRLVFESDLANDPSVRHQLDRVLHETAALIAEVIHDDTGLPEAASHLLAVSLVGMGQVGARYWVDNNSTLSKEEAVQLAISLAWRGIGGFPRTEEDKNQGEE